MGKIIFILLIIGLIYMLFKKKNAPSNTTIKNLDELVQCDKCKTFYPQNEIYKINKKNVCKDCYANS